MTYCYISDFFKSKATLNCNHLKPFLGVVDWILKRWACLSAGREMADTHYEANKAPPEQQVSFGPLKSFKDEEDQIADKSGNRKALSNR